MTDEKVVFVHTGSERKKKILRQNGQQILLFSSLALTLFGKCSH